ncbi:hypothetical protein IMSAG049_00777 [Clostridiales bacterium]|nr:hypothetical protein IMSAG049_00777 [Clostridiales bacterium]
MRPGLCVLEMSERRIRGQNTVSWAGLGCVYFRIGKIQSKRVEKNYCTVIITPKRLRFT